MSTTRCLVGLIILAMTACGKTSAPAAPVPHTAAAPKISPLTPPQPEADPAAEARAAAGQDVAINEPMPPVDEESAPPKIIVRAQFKAIAADTVVTGEVTIYRADDGSRLLRIENLHAPSAALDLVFVRAIDPKTADDLKGMVALGALKGPTGNMNYLLERSLNLADLHTLALLAHGSNAIVAVSPLTAPHGG